MQESMPLVRIHGVDDARLDRVPVPHPGDDDVLIEVHQCGICGSDLGYLASGGLFGPGNAMALGHELSGRVIEAGSAVSHVAPGDRVVVNPEINGIGNGGPEGGFAPYLLVRDAATNPATVIALPDSLDDEVGAMVEPLAVAMHGVRQGRAVSSDKVVVFGAGPIGLCTVLVLDYLGVEDIVSVDLNEARLAAARSLGAATFDARSGDLAGFLIDRHGLVEHYAMQLPASDLYIEATGVGDVFSQALALACPGARVAVVGVHKAPVQLDLLTVLMKEINIVGSMAYKDEFERVIDMLEGGKVDPKKLISHRFTLEHFDRALAAAKDQSQGLKVLVDCTA